MQESSITLQQIYRELRRVAGLPAIAGSSGPVAEGWILQRIHEVVAGWSPSAGGGEPGGADTQVQFNDGDAFGGDAGLTYDKVEQILSTVALALGEVPAQEGAIRLSYGSESYIMVRNQGDDDDLKFMEMFSDIFSVAGGLLLLDVTLFEATFDGKLNLSNGLGVTGAVITSLPTADPVVAGQLWNDAGVVKVSTG